VQGLICKPFSNSFQAMISGVVICRRRSVGNRGATVVKPEIGCQQHESQILNQNESQHSLKISTRFSLTKITRYDDRVLKADFQLFLESTPSWIRNLAHG
jgi:hypothetical protein